MNEATKIKLTAIAMRLQGHRVSESLIFSLIKTLDKIELLGEDFSLKDAIAITLEAEKKYKE